MRTISICNDQAEGSVDFTVREAVKLLTAIRIKVDGVAQYRNRQGDRVGVLLLADDADVELDKAVSVLRGAHFYIEEVG